jgi:MerR family transcriptional regulator, light-induced transcriptional regulator
MFAALRQRHPALAPVRLSKRTLVALSHAIEDEAAAWAERGLLVGCFQRRRFYQESKRRWRDLPSGARLALPSQISAACADRLVRRPRCRFSQPTR